MRVRFLPAAPLPCIVCLFLLTPIARASAQPSTLRASIPESSSAFDPSALPLALLSHPTAAAADPAPPRDHPVEPYPTNRYLAPLSRVGIGADISPLGIGIKGAVNLNLFMDARLDADFFSFSSGRFEIEGVNADASLHMDSAAALVDFYPWSSVWRLSAGLMFLNGNQFSGTTRIAGGKSFTLDGQTFYSANANAATGASPITGTGVLGFHARNPAVVLTGGFGNFVPRAYRHWSFPSEFGVIFTGAPTVNVNLSGWACLDAAETQCSRLSNSSNPVAIEFNNALNAQLAKWRRGLSNFPIYPVFTYSVIYSFDLP